MSGENFNFWLHNGGQLRPFRSALNGGWFKLKTTDAILLPHMMSTIKSLRHHAQLSMTHPTGYAGQAPVRRRRPVQFVHSPRCLHGMRHAGGHDPGEKNIYTVKDWFGPSISYLYIESMYCTCFL